MVHICEYDAAKVSTVRNDLDTYWKDVVAKARPHDIPVGVNSVNESLSRAQRMYLENLHAWIMGTKTAS
jgi:hypothetical protein